MLGMALWHDDPDAVMKALIILLSTLIHLGFVARGLGRPRVSPRALRYQPVVAETRFGANDPTTSATAWLL